MGNQGGYPDYPMEFYGPYMGQRNNAAYMQYSADLKASQPIIPGIGT